MLEPFSKISPLPQIGVLGSVQEFLETNARNEREKEREFFFSTRKIYYPRVHRLPLSFPRATLSRANWQVTRCNKFAGWQAGVVGRLSANSKRDEFTPVSVTDAGVTAPRLTELFSSCATTPLPLRQRDIFARWWSLSNARPILNGMEICAESAFNLEMEEWNMVIRWLLLLWKWIMQLWRAFNTRSRSLSLSFRLSKGESCAKLFRSGFYLFKTLGGNEAINDSRK